MGKKTKKTDAASEDGEEDAKGGKLKLIIGAVVLVVVGGVLGIKVLGGGGATAEAAGPTTTTTAPPGVVHTIDPITLNLADGRFLKLGLAFEVRHDAAYPSEAEMADSQTRGFAREIDAAITAMGSFTYEELQAPNGKLTAKRKLLEEAQRISDDAVEDVLFHEFVMQ